MRLRKMRADDIGRFSEWLAMPHVTKWFQNPADWIEEIEKQDDAFAWIHHYIVECEGIPVGFCQYYATEDSGEDFAGYTALGGTYSIDYLIGDAAYLKRGIGKQIVAALLEKIARHADAQRVVVDPEPENAPSRRLLTSCDFLLDRETGIYVKAL